ncbi:armadillo-type protein [Mycotypha africana]|uniref:armadillo-type protein n=1 Tax=Mycotypha africana TaxID=64632 RepID=UPI0023001FE0|nr:armadillo-type protein [Mycotypha africana]KAI8975114.1 armadillo-type protein [Mycotypha africana]
MSTTATSAEDERRNLYFASLCEQLYNPKSPEERIQVQKLLEKSFPTFSDTASSNPAPISTPDQPSFVINNPTDTANALRMLLESSPNPYVQSFCLSRLKQLVQAQFSIFDQETKVQLRSFLLNYAFMHPDLLPFIISQLASVLAIITLMGWADIEQYRQVYEYIHQFIQASIDHRIVGMQILSIMIQDMNPPSFVRSTSKFRKAAGEFRDTQLFKICETAFKTLEELINHTVAFTNPNQEQRLQEAALNLLIKCFSYDFNGTSADESGEDVGLIHIPSSWRSLFENPDFLKTLYKAYSQFQPPISSKVMECLVLVSAVRKTLFSDQQLRSDFIVGVMQGIREIIMTSQGLNDVDNYNEFCRLLFRFRATVPMNEMVEKTGFIEWIELIADFSLRAFQSWKFAPNTSMYVLGFWSKMIQSTSYYQQLGNQALEKLEAISVELVRAYISTSIEAVPVRIDEGLDDPLENEEQLLESMNMLGHIAHCKYEGATTTLMQMFDPITVQYQELITQATQNTVTNMEAFKEALEVIETKFAWLVYIMASFVGNRTAYLNSEDLDKLDSEITTKVLQLMNVQQSLQSQHGNAFMNDKLDLAFIYFFSQFKKSYMSEANGREIYAKLTQVFGISDQISMLDMIMRKIVSNLQYWANNEQLIRRTLELFNELASGYGASKNLRKIETTQLILQNHMDSQFAFCQTNDDKQNENRIVYFQVLCKLLFAEDNVDEKTFVEFMKPFDLRFNDLGPLDSVESFRQESTRRNLRDIFIDMYGFISPIQARRHFVLFFDWFYDSYSSVLLRAIEAWSPDPIVNPLLLFYGELVHNKSQRLNFEISSTNGILMFKDASQIICSFGQGLLKQPLISYNESQKYEYKYKAIASCFNILSRSLGGRYVNFGVLWLYQDKAINDALEMVIQLMLNIPLEDLLAYPKLALSYFQMLDELAREQLMELPTISPEAFVYLMQACEQGIESSDTIVRSHACSAVFSICSFAIKETEKAEIQRDTVTSSSSPTASHNNLSTRRQRRSSAFLQQQQQQHSQQSHWIVNYLQQFPQTLPTLLACIFHLILFEDNSDQWTLSRPLYALMLLQRDYAFKYTNAVIEQQLPERRTFVTNALNNLLDGVEWTLSAKDRERFTHNISGFRRVLNLNNVVLTPLSSPPPF